MHIPLAFLSLPLLFLLRSQHRIPLLLFEDAEHVSRGGITSSPAKTSANWIWAADKRPISWPSWPLRDPLTGGPRYPFNRRLKLVMREIRTFFFLGGSIHSVYTTGRGSVWYMGVIVGWSSLSDNVTPLVLERL